MRIHRKLFAWGIVLLNGLSAGALLHGALAVSPLILLQPVFHLGYSLASDKASFLRRYNAQLEAHAGWYIPERADAFLCERLRTAPDAEAGAIVDFYASKSHGRLGQYIYALPTATRERIITLALGRMDLYTPRLGAEALVLIESLRKGEDLGKARLVGDQHAAGDLAVARRAFESWWRRDEPWAQKAARDPLAGTALSIEAP